MNKRFKKIFALIMCLIIMATTCAISVSAVVINSVECVSQSRSSATWKAKSNFTQSYIRLRVEYIQKNNTNGALTFTSGKDIRYNVASLSVVCYPTDGNSLFKPNEIIAEFANGVTVYPESINDEII